MLDLSDIGAAHRLRLVENIILVLAVESSKLLPILKIEVGLDGVEEHYRVARWHLQDMINYIL